MLTASSEEPEYSGSYIFPKVKLPYLQPFLEQHIPNIRILRKQPTHDYLVESFWIIQRGARRITINIWRNGKDKDNYTLVVPPGKSEFIDTIHQVMQKFVEIP